MSLEWSQILEQTVTFLQTSPVIDNVTFSRNYKPKNEFENLNSDSLVAVVYPSNESTVMLNRANALVTREVGIALSGRIDADSTADGLDFFLSKVKATKSKLLGQLRSTTMYSGNVDLFSVNNDPVYDYEKFSNHAEFQSLLILTIRDQSAI